MNINELKDYLIEHKILANPEVSLLGKGESNVNYLAKEGEIAYVIRMPRGDMPGGSRYEAEHHFMLFIEAYGIEFAPRSIHYDQERDIHIVSYLGGKDASVVDLNDEQVGLFVRQLKRLNNIDYDEYLGWCKRAGQSPREPLALAERNKVNIEDRVDTIREAVPTGSFASDVIAWTAPKIELLHAAADDANLRTTFLHDDLRWTDYGGNLRIVGDQLYFIDWELSGFFDDAVPEIGDVLGSIPNMEVNQTILRRLYKDYISEELGQEELDKSIKYGVLWGKLGNPLWAAERYVTLMDQNHPDVERYRQLAEEGMKDAEFFFSTPFKQWFK